MGGGRRIYSQSMSEALSIFIHPPPVHSFDHVTQLRRKVNANRRLISRCGPGPNLCLFSSWRCDGPPSAGASLRVARDQLDFRDKGSSCPAQFV